MEVIKLLIREGRLMELILLITFMTIMYALMKMASEKKYLPEVRRLPALDAIDEATGRSTEMGTPFMADTGFARTMTDIGFRESLAGMSVLVYAADKCAEKKINMVVGVAAPEAIPMVTEMIRESYTISGAADIFSQNVIRYTTSVGMGYPIQIMGLLLEFNPAVFMTVGMMASSTVIYAETAHKLGALTIGGTASVGNIPFVVGCYDYILMGEEIFAAGAYVSRESEQIGTIAGIDISKLILMTISILGIFLSYFGNDIIKNILGM